MPDSATDNRDLAPALIAYCAWLLLLLLGINLAYDRTWGFSLLAFAGSPVRIGFAVAAFAGLLAIIISLPSITKPQIGDRASLVIAVLASLLLGVLLHAREAYLGDGTMRAMDTSKGIGYIPSEFLPSFLAGALGQIMPVESGAKGYWALRILSILSGAGLIAGLWYLIPRALGYGRRSLIFWTLSAGSIRLFAGYIESYALPFAFFTMWIVAALGYYDRKIGAGWLVALWIGGMLSHVTAVVLIPATLWLLARDAHGRFRLNSAALLLHGAAIVIVAGVVVAAFYIKQVNSPGIPTGHFFVTLTSQPPHNYGLLSPDHLYDFLNFWLLVAPAVIVAAALVLMLRLARAARRHVSLPSVDTGSVTFWFLSAIIPVGAGFLVDPKLGWARDWDLYALLSAPALVGMAIWLDGLTGRARRTAIVVAALWAALWLSFSVDGRAEQRRFETLLELDPTRSDYGHEIMAQQYRREGDHQGMLRHYRAALAVTENHRYRMNIAASYYYLGRFDEAERWYRGVVERDSSNAAAYHGLSLALTELGRTEAAVNAAERAVVLEPNSAIYGFRLGSALLDAQRYNDALPYLEACRRSNPRDAAVANALAACYLGLNRLDEATSAIEEAIRLQPDVGVVWLNAARIAMRRGEFDNTAKYLQEYQMRVPPESRRPETQLLLDSLARIPDTSR